MRLFAKIQNSVSTTAPVAFCQVLFDGSANSNDAEQTINFLLDSGKIDKSFVPMHGLKHEAVPTKDGRVWNKAVINLRSDDESLVTRLRADASVRKMDALATESVAPAESGAY